VLFKPEHDFTMDLT